MSSKPDGTPEQEESLFTREGSRRTWRRLSSRRRVLGIPISMPRILYDQRRRGVTDATGSTPRAAAGAAAPGQIRTRLSRLRGAVRGFVARRGMILRYLRVFRQRRRRVIGLLILSFFAVILEAVFPWATKFIIDDILPAGDQRLLVAVCGGILVCGLLWLALSGIRDYGTRVLLGWFVTRMKRLLMQHLVALPLPRLRELKVGGVVSRLQADTEGMQGLIQNLILTPFHALLMLTVSVVSLSILNWKVMLICLFLGSFAILLSYGFLLVMLPYRKDLREEIARIGSRLTNTFEAIHVVRAFNRERSEARAYATRSHLNWRRTLHADVINLVAVRLSGLSQWVLLSALWLAGGYMVMGGHMRVGELMAFFFFMNLLFQPLFMIVGTLGQMQRTLACTERVFDILDEPVGMPDRAGARAHVGMRSDIRVEGVQFQYPDGTRALKGVDLVLPVGSATAIVGPSGAGKTTAAFLLARFYDPSQGRIVVDGLDIREYRLRAYRAAVAFVPQDILLFDASVYENIAYGNPKAEPDAVFAAARAAHCHEFMDELEKGYDTDVGELGGRLSAGQRQRIAIARALVRNPRLLILDEPTAHLDPENELYVRRMIQGLAGQCTVVVIAHRQSTALAAPRIAVMEEGKVVEIGVASELLAADGAFSRLYGAEPEQGAVPGTAG